jgi:hypothetical protein
MAWGRSAPLVVIGLPMLVETPMQLHICCTLGTHRDSPQGDQAVNGGWTRVGNVSREGGSGS